MKINEINESIHKNNINSRDQINQLEKNNREFGISYLLIISFKAQQSALDSDVGV